MKGGLGGLAALVSCAAVSCTLSGCTGAPLEWRIRFQNRADATATTVVEALVRRQTCDGEVIWRGTVSQGSALEGMGVPALADGRYALDVTAWDASCRPVASACQLVDAPFRGPVIVELASAPGEAACAAGSCVAGLCTCEGAACDAGVSIDAAPTHDDADHDDADRHDAGTDAAEPPLDAFSPDAFVVPPSSPPAVIAPWNGVTTGAPVSAASLEDPPLRPLFVWEAVADAGSYLIELTRCDRADWRSCPLDTPSFVERVGGDVTRARPSSDLAVSTDVPVGARYVFRVGACTTSDHRGCTYSEPRYLDVGRSASDVDGDGTGDLLAAASDGTSANLYDVELSPPSLRTGPSLPTVNRILPIGDYDADGIAEVVVVAPDASSAGGRWLFVDELLVAGEERSTVAGARLGVQVARLGDIDGDGYADFAVAAPGLNEVRVQYGSPTFDLALRATIVPPTGVTEFALDLCGAGDLDGDGRAELAMLTRESTTTALTVRIFTQRDPAVRALREVPALDVMTATGFTEFSPDGYKYAELDCGGDVDGDGRPDLVIGRHRADTVTVYTSPRTQVSVATPVTSALGWDLALGDLDGTGRLTILASRSGIPDGGRNGTARVRFDTTTRLLGLTDYDDSYFLVSAGSDYDGDGRDDAVVRATDLRVHLEDGTVVTTVAPPVGRTWGAVSY